ncbi:MAG: PocR ligand-binding domain-containing protein, partial [Eubacteriales bacterium]|nr:PocR ligand-binding domain-containing protein [Eubacteriales bacterium]
MKLEFNEDQLLQLMKDFYILTNIRIVLFDDEYREVLAYPRTECPFCRVMKENPETQALCKESDAHSFQQSKATGQLLIYHCHAGLIEATIPLIDNHTVIGYLMFGQISDTQTLRELTEMLSETLKQHQLPVDTSYCMDIPLKTDLEIQAAAKIMEACTFYVLYDEAIALRRQNFVNNLKNYLLAHLQENLTADVIARELNISRSKLYLACDKNLGMGIAEYVKLLRIDEAKHLLKNTD